jgi:hypothetical protein
MCELKNIPSERHRAFTAPCGDVEPSSRNPAGSDPNVGGSARIAWGGIHGRVTVECLRQNATTLHQQGRLSKASEHYCFILAVEPNHFGALCGLATVCLQLGKLNDAVALYRRDVVDDLEGQARRMLWHCGLEWEEACLAFHKTPRPVRTASVAQVRRPIYRSSIGRWRPYKHLLQPLLQALEFDPMRR